MNLNGNLDVNLNGDLDRNLNGNQPWTTLGLNLDQKVSLGAPWWILGDPWVVLGPPCRGPLGTKLGPRTGPAPVWHQGPKKCLKCVTVVKNRPRDKRPGTARHQILGPPRGLSEIAY